MGRRMLSSLARGRRREGGTPRCLSKQSPVSTAHQAAGLRMTRTGVNALRCKAMRIGANRLDDEARCSRAGRDRVSRVTVIERCEDSLKRLAIGSAVAAVRVSGS